MSSNTENKSFLNLIKKRIFLILSLVAVLILFLTLIIFSISQNNKNQFRLIDVFGRQRMITQMLTKDANRKYAIMQILENGPFVAPDETLNQRIDAINDYMKKEKHRFSSKLSTLHQEYIQQDDETIHIGSYTKDMSDLIASTDGDWEAFSNAIHIVIESSQADSRASEALTYINMNNESLLGDCEGITDGLVSAQNNRMYTITVVSLFLFSITIGLLFVSIFELYKYIVQPLDALYKGINNLNILKTSSNLSAPTKNELLPVIAEINDGFNKLNKLVQLIENLNQNMSFDGILEHIFYSFSEYIPYSHIGIALLKEDEKVLEASYGICDPSLRDLPKKLSGVKANINETSLADVILKGKPRVINDLKNHVEQSHSNKAYNRILLQAGINSSIALPLNINSRPIGVIFFSSIYKDIYKQQHITFLEALSSSIAISLNKNIFIDELLYSTILALAKMAEARDEDTGDHLQRMKKYSVRIAEYLLADHIYEDVVSLRFLKDIERFSPMHDIGKVGIRDGILLKAGKLSAEEFDEMKKHTIYGAEVLRTAESNIQKQNRSLFKIGIEIAEGHHEKWDGTGYPYKKAGYEIPLSARIVAVADVFDALTSKRPYKNAYSFQQSFDLIVDGKGKHFDPLIIDTVIKHREDIFKLYKSFNVEL